MNGYLGEEERGHLTGKLARDIVPLEEIENL